MDSLDDALPDDLRALAMARGVLVTYLDHGGVPRTARRDAVVAVLTAIGEAQAGSDPTAALAELRAREDARLLSPVEVVQADAIRPVGIDAQVAAGTSTLECELVLEDGSAVDWVAPVVARADGSAHHLSATIELPGVLPPGYHSLSVRAGTRDGTTTVLVRPPGGARGRFDDDWRAVGLAAPLFTLHGEGSWGCGDLGDLDELASMAAPHGASVVATLPLLAGFGPEPFEVSPYVPLSRQFWNERWLDVDAALHGASSSLAAHADGVARGLRDAAAASHPYVDGAASLASKRDVLVRLLAELRADSSPRLKEFEAFVADRPGVVDYARFRAAGERYGIDWARWPAAMRDGVVGGGDVDADVVDFHAFAQWLTHEQLVSLVERFERRGQVLSLDLPLGVHGRGFDTWAHRAEFATGLAVGAPPDRFFPKGQQWGFPPPHVDAIRSNGHALFRAALHHHLNVASMLRIDHVLGMQRLFCVPDGATARDGVYLKMPLEELLAVAAIEAQRHRGAIVGEDLGTVDATVRRAMQRDGIRRTFVVQLAVRAMGAAPFVVPPDGAVASFSSHDMPTFQGWWRCRDVDERVALGQVDDDTGQAMRAKRRAERARLSALSSSPEDRSDPSFDGAPDEGVLAAAYDALARSDAGVVLAQLDDVLGELDAVNLPGTSTERRNWQRRTDLSLEAIAEDPRLGHALERLRDRRPTDEDAESTRGGRRVATVFDVSRFDDDDAARFVEGRHARLFDRLGAHTARAEGIDGTHFSVWAPNAAWVEVVGDFNGWDGHRHPLARREGTGVWEGFVADVGVGERYKFRLASTLGGDILDKADPFAQRTELPPATASIVGDGRDLEWHDDAWLSERARRQNASAPVAIYEVHLGSWQRDPDDPDRLLTYRELAPRLVEYVTGLGFTHVELLPVMEHPYFGSWGYKLSGFFSPTARYGTPEEFAALVDALHVAGVGVLLDWVPAHFPDDAFALATFDGSHLFEHPDETMRVHPDWHSLIFNYARGEVRSFLLSAACFWLDRYHVDGLRFDAVASMLYLDYSRGPGEWVPNALGGRENLDAVELLQTCNEEIHRAYPGTITVAEESTTWPGVTAPVAEGGLGFDFKWDLGWMHDTLDYLHRDPVHRQWHQDQLTFRSLYATSEQFVLPLSHDEVVHGKGSLLSQMAGDDWQRLANLRLLYGSQLLQPGKKLLFMGDSFGQEREWAHDRALDWGLLERPEHLGVTRLVGELNALYTRHPALHRDDLEDRGFRWIDGDDRLHSVASVERHDGADEHLVVVCNATPEPREGYEVGMPVPGHWALLVSSDDTRFGGSGYAVRATVTTSPSPLHRRPHRAAMSLPPLGFVIYRATETHA